MDEATRIKIFCLTSWVWEQSAQELCVSVCVCLRDECQKKRTSFNFSLLEHKDWESHAIMPIWLKPASILFSDLRSVKNVEKNVYCKLNGCHKYFWQQNTVGGGGKNGFTKCGWTTQMSELTAMVRFNNWKKSPIPFFTPNRYKFYHYWHIITSRRMLGPTDWKMENTPSTLQRDLS